MVLQNVSNILPVLWSPFKRISATQKLQSCPGLAKPSWSLGRTFSKLKIIGLAKKTASLAVSQTLGIIPLTTPLLAY